MFYSGNYDPLGLDENSNGDNKSGTLCSESFSIPSQSFNWTFQPLSQMKFQPEDDLACGLPPGKINSDVSERQWEHSKQNTCQEYFLYTHYDFVWLYVPSR